MTAPDKDAILAAIVKPLVWEHHPMGFIAAPPTGKAYIIDIRVKGRVMFIKGMDPSPQVASVSAAQAAAEADYRARIAAALDVDKLMALVGAGRLAEKQLIRLGYDGSSSGLTAALAALGVQP